MPDSLFNLGDLDIKFYKMNIYSFLILILHFFLNFRIIQCEDYICKTNNDFSKNICFNNIIILNSNKYRAGEFVTTKNGELLIEYSQDSIPGGGRLFYRLTPDGRGYYPGSNPIKEFEINKTVSTNKENGTQIECSGRYEARNLLVTLEGDTSGKEYLFSTSSWYSFTELYDLESDTYWTWLTSTFFEIPDNKYIFSYKYDLLRPPDSNYYFLVYIQYKETTKSGEESVSSSEYYAIKKFSIKSVNGTFSETIEKSIYNTDNYDNRVISSIIMESDNVIVVYFVKSVSNSPKLFAISYDYNLEEKFNTEVTNFGLDKGEGTFFEGVYLDGSFTAVIYYLEKNDKKLWIKLYEYNPTTGFKDKFYREINDYTLKAYLTYNDVYKINKYRIIFTCKADDNKLYIYFI